ncbi:MAG: pantetheine-phosphate adenylyltransferase, partial [Anaeroplasma sp.]
IFDEVHVLVSYNINKQYSFSVEERIAMLKECVKSIPNVQVKASNDLVVNYCKENGINIIVRGMRNYSDYENEFSLYQYNKDIYPDVETIILMPSSKNQVVSSSAIKELVSFNCDIERYVPSCIKDKIVSKLKKS